MKLSSEISRIQAVSKYTWTSLGSDGVGVGVGVGVGIGVGIGVGVGVGVGMGVGTDTGCGGRVGAGVGAGAVQPLIARPTTVKRRSSEMSLFNPHLPSHTDCSIMFRLCQ